MKFTAVILLSFVLGSPVFAGPVRLGQCVGGKPKNEYCSGMWRFNIRRSEDGKLKIGIYGGSTVVNSLATWTVNLSRKNGELHFTDAKGGNFDLRIRPSTPRTYHGISHNCVSKEHREFKGSAGVVTAFKPFSGEDLKLDGFPVVCQWYGVGE